MQEISIVKEKINNKEMDDILSSIYTTPDTLEYNRGRYVAAIDKFAELFPEAKEIEIYSAPGRTEVCGNHTDHQNGMVLAASVNLDAIAVVSKTDDNTVKIVSGDFPIEIIDLDDIGFEFDEKETGTALIKGVINGLVHEGFEVGGFVAYITSDVLIGAGMSSSAAFETLIGTVISGLYNEMDISPVKIAQAGQYAENVFFGKPSGLMDQMASSVGGMIFIDFADKRYPVYSQIDCDIDKAGYSLCIVDTLGSHEDLTAEYAAVPQEMNEVAVLLGRKHLRKVDEAEFYENIAKLVRATSGRAVLRSIHFFEEEKRVVKASEALKAGDYEQFLKVIAASGKSSAMNLQNIYAANDKDQSVAVALATSAYILGDAGVCRVHGGGFAGTIQAFVKNDAVANYKTEIEKIFGENSCHVLKIRKQGGIKVL